MSVVSTAPLDESPDPMLLVAEAAKKSAVAWVSGAGGTGSPLWFGHEGGAPFSIPGGAHQGVAGTGDARPQAST